MSDDDGVALGSMAHPVERNILLRWWQRFRNAVWPYKLTPSSLVDGEIELPDRKD